MEKIRKYNVIGLAPVLGERSQDLGSYRPVIAYKAVSGDVVIDRDSSEYKINNSATVNPSGVDDFLAGYTKHKVVGFIPADHVFPMVVRLPHHLDKGKLRQIVRCEAEQNLPFGVDEMLWNYRFQGTDGCGSELLVNLVSVKRGDVQRLFPGVSLDMLCDPNEAIAGLYRTNLAARQETGILIPDTHSTNLVIANQAGLLFARSTPVSVYDEILIQKEMEQSRSHGGSTDEQGLREIALRRILTRTKAELNRVFNFYRAQCGGGHVPVVLCNDMDLVRSFDGNFLDRELRFENPLLYCSILDTKSTAIPEKDYLGAAAAFLSWPNGVDLLEDHCKASPFQVGLGNLIAKVGQRITSGGMRITALGDILKR